MFHTKFGHVMRAIVRDVYGSDREGVSCVMVLCAMSVVNLSRYAEGSETGRFRRTERC